MEAPTTKSGFGLRNLIRRQSSTEAERCKQSLTKLVEEEQKDHQHHRGALQQISQTEDWTNHEILDAILDQNPSKLPFLCKQQWEGLFSTATVRDLVDCDDAAANDIRRNHIQILAILVYIGAFRSIKNILGSHRDRARDELLPFTDDVVPLSFIRQETHLSHNFKREQHLFCPVVIRETEHQDHIKARRLPFRKMTLLGGGAYGAVFRVEIPGHHFHPANENGPMVQAKCFAVKIFRDRSDFNTERTQLERLKTSTAKHDHIMLHQATMSYRNNYLVLLPLAELGDLRQFLYVNHVATLDPSEPHIPVDFLRLSVSERKDIQLALMTECMHVADALQWLHNGRPSTTDHIFAHLDLKPDNILLTRRDDYPFGCWKLADFSLAVCPRRSRSSESAAHEWHSRKPLHRPQTGDYSAPEFASNIEQVGRSSDVWSFACILSEVLTLALTDRDQVKEFHKLRKHGENHAFYTVRQSRELAPAAQASYYAVVKPEVDAWLERLCEREEQNQWIICFTCIVRKYLDPRQDRRPSSDVLLQDLKHGVRHLESHHQDIDRECRALLNHQYSETSSNPPDNPLIEITPQTPTSPGVSLLSNSPQADMDTFPEISSPSLRQGDTSISRPPGVSALSNYKVSEQFCLPYLVASRRRVAKSVAISCTARTMGWLFVDSKTTDSETASVEVLTLKNSRSPASFCDAETDYQNWALNRIPLDHRSPWKYMAIAGQYLLVWTSLKNQTISVFSRNIASNESLPLPDSLELFGFLNKVVLSPKGIAIFICTDKLKTMHLTSSSDNLSDGMIMPSKGHYFCDAVCNDEGDYIYAWSYADDGCHYLYTCAVDQRNNVQVLYTHRYKVTLPRQQRMSLTPYARREGCIVQDERKNFFPAQVKPDPPGSSTTPLDRPSDKEIPAALVLKMYRHRSLLVVENHSTWPRSRKLKLRLEEYPIEIGNRSGHDVRIIGQGKQLCGLKGEANGDSRIGIMENDVESGTVVIVICNTNSTYEVVKLVRNS